MALKFYIRSISLILTLVLGASSITSVFLTVYGHPNHQIGQFENWKYREPIILKETAGVDRVLEPVDYHMSFEDEKCLDASKEIRVATEDGVEVPSQVYNMTTHDSGYTKSCNVVFQANCTANSNATYLLYYGNPAATKPTYPTDLSLMKVEGGIGIYVENSHFIVSLATDTAWITSLLYKSYDRMQELLKSEWTKLLTIVTKIAGIWYGPWETFDINTYVKCSGPVFIDIESIFGNWTNSGVMRGVVNFRFYAYVPWFTYNVKLALGGADFAYLLVSSYFSPIKLPYAVYKLNNGSLNFVDLTTTNGIGDITDWQFDWIDIENTTQSPENPVAVSLIMLNGTNPWWKGWRNGGSGEVAPYIGEILTAADLKMVVQLHKSDYTITEQFYEALTHPLHEVGVNVPVIGSYPVSVAVIDKVSGQPATDVVVKILFVNGTVFKQNRTNIYGAVTFTDVPEGKYIIKVFEESKDITVTMPVKCTLRVLVPYFTSLIYTGISIGICFAIIITISLVKRRKVQKEKTS